MRFSFLLFGLSASLYNSESAFMTAFLSGADETLSASQVNGLFKMKRSAFRMNLKQAGKNHDNYIYLLMMRVSPLLKPSTSLLAI